MSSAVKLLLIDCKVSWTASGTAASTRAPRPLPAIPGLAIETQTTDGRGQFSNTQDAPAAARAVELQVPAESTRTQERVMAAHPAKAAKPHARTACRRVEPLECAPVGARREFLSTATAASVRSHLRAQASTLPRAGVAAHALQWVCQLDQGAGGGAGWVFFLGGGAGVRGRRAAGALCC